MTQSLAPAFWLSISGSAFLAVAKHLNEGLWKTVVLALGVVCLVFALGYGFMALLDRLNSPLWTIGEIIEKLAYPEIALVTAFGKLSPVHLDAYLVDSGRRLYMIDEAGKPDWAIKSMGRELPSHWVSQFLYRANQTFPDLPAVRRNPDGSVINMDERAMIAFLRALKMVRPRSGQTDIWAEGETPDLFRAAYFG